MKQKIFLLFILPILFAASCQHEVEESSAISAIPTRSAFVVRINDLHELALDLDASVPGMAIKSSIIFNHLNDFVNLLDSYRTNKEKTIKAFGGFDQYGAGSFGWIWAMSDDELPFMTETVLSTKGTLSSRPYGSGEIIHFQSEALTFYYAKQNGLLLLSEQENLVESALKQLESGIDLTADARFMHTLKTTNSKDPVNVFMQFSSMPDWLENMLSQRVDWPANFATWTALDLDINTNDINFTGISLVPDSAATYVKLFDGAGKGSNQFDEIIPQNTSLAVSQTCGDFAVWQSNFATFLGKKNKLKKRNNLLESLQINPAEWMAFVDEEIGIFYSDVALSSAESKNGFIRTDDPALASEKFKSASGEFSEMYREVEIRKLNKRHALPLVFGKIFSHLSEPYWFAKNNWIVFSNDLATAKSTLNNLLADKTWSTTSSYESISDYKDSDAHLVVVARNPEFTNLVLKELNDDNGKNLSKSKESIATVNWILVELKQQGDAASTKVVLLHETQTQGNAKQYWGVDLEAEAITRPQLVYNHHTKQNNVVVQDKNNNLYWVDPKGQVLWKRKLDSPILGEISQVDLYKNNKLQLIFNTSTRVYLIDRNGKDVSGFPIKLDQNATAPMATFDYEKTRKYRFVVPCGNQLYNYDGDAKKVKGWNFKKAEAQLNEQPKHAVIGSKDFIYTTDKNGNVYVLNRRGEIREPIKSKLKNLASSIYLVGDKNAGGKLNALSKSGYTLSLFLNDQLDSIQPYREQPKYMFVSGKTQLFAAENELYKRDDAANFNIELDEEIIQEPRIYRVDSKNYFTVSTRENQIWVYDDTGVALPGMPLYGNGIATVGKTSGKELHVIVTTSEGALLDYKLSE